MPNSSFCDKFGSTDQVLVELCSALMIMITCVLLSGSNEIRNALARGILRVAGGGCPEVVAKARDASAKSFSHGRAVLVSTFTNAAGPLERVVNAYSILLDASLARRINTCQERTCLS